MAGNRPIRFHANEAGGADGPQAPDPTPMGHGPQNAAVYRVVPPLVKIPVQMIDATGGWVDSKSCPALPANESRSPGRGQRVLALGPPRGRLSV
jgi:hypothetical protein